MSKLSFSDQLARLRGHASLVYDRGVLAGLKREEVAKEIEPIRELMDRLIDDHAKRDLASCALAISQLERHAEGFLKDAEILRQRAEDARSHAQAIRAAIAKHMIHIHKSILEQGGVFATLIETPQGSVVELR